jgi:hypothetical protein
MREQVPTRFLLNAIAALSVYFFRPDWFSGGLPGLWLVLSTMFMSMFVVYRFLLAVTEIIVPAEHQGTASEPWLYLALLSLGTAPLLWIAFQTKAEPTLIIMLASALTGIFMAASARWNRARSRGSAATE